MFKIRLVTEAFAPGQTVTLRWAPNWDLDRGGVYTRGGWEFDIDETRFADGINFKFVVAPGRWMSDDDLYLAPDEMWGEREYTTPPITFPPQTELLIENSHVAQRFFTRNIDPNHVYDVLVVGSGMGGGILASRLADAGADVLVLEAGSYLFPTHVGNLPRRLRFGPFDKHIWSLWPDFRVVNYVNTPGSQFAGGQGFNLGGRSLFWGGLIPRQAPWELRSWPVDVRTYLLDDGFDAAEAALNRVDPPPSDYQEAVRTRLGAIFADHDCTHAEVAAQYSGPRRLSIGTGLFSTADLLMEDRLVDDPGPGRTRPLVNLNIAVHAVNINPNNPREVTGVQAHDLLGRQERTFSADRVVLAAGTFESAKIALQSGLRDPAGKIGRGVTDHPIRYRHFALPPDADCTSATDSAKVLLRHRQATQTGHGFNALVELGSDFNQGRYVDPENLAREREVGQGWMLCELVFMWYSDLDERNMLTVTGNPADPVRVSMGRPVIAPNDVKESEQIASGLFQNLDARPVLGEDGLALQWADLGAVAHEVGTLRMADGDTGVVDPDLKFLDYDNLYACDNSVFPASPAANPSLTLAALALRLAGHLTERE
jgi:choline dehydrogenase-like flavoprotein